MDKSYVGMGVCYYCGEPKSIILDKKLKDSLPKKAVYDYEPCDICKGFMEQGIIVIGIRDGEKGNNPYRTGEFFVVKESFFKVILSGKRLKEVLKKRFAFMEQSTLEALGFKINK